MAAKSSGYAAARSKYLSRIRTLSREGISVYPENLPTGLPEVTGPLIHTEEGNLWIPMQSPVKAQTLPTMTQLRKSGMTPQQIGGMTRRIRHAAQNLNQQAAAYTSPVTGKTTMYNTVQEARRAAKLDRRKMADKGLACYRAFREALAQDPNTVPVKSNRIHVRNPAVVAASIQAQSVVEAYVDAVVVTIAESMGGQEAAESWIGYRIAEEQDLITDWVEHMLGGYSYEIVATAEEHLINFFSRLDPGTRETNALRQAAEDDVDMKSLAEGMESMEGAAAAGMEAGA